MLYSTDLQRQPVTSERIVSLEHLSVIKVKSFLPKCIVPREVCKVKRVKVACILQTLIFSQKDEMGYSKERAIQINREEIEHYKKSLERAKTRYIVVDEAEQEDGSIIVHVKKQYNDKADVSEYFN